MCIWVVFVSNLAEKLDLVLACEERCRDRVNRRITPALFVWLQHLVIHTAERVERWYLVIKATMAIEVVEICRVSLAAPKIQIGNLKIAPN